MKLIRTLSIKSFPHHRNKILSLSLLLALFAGNIQSQEFPVIPMPKELIIRKGSFILDKECVLKFDTSNDEVSRIAGFFNDYLEKVYGFKAEGDLKGKPVHFKIMTKLDTGKEGYLLKVDNKGIFITEWINIYLQEVAD